MRIEEQNEAVEKFFERAKNLFLSKNRDYCPNEEAFETAKACAQSCGTTTLTVLWVNFFKHVKAVETCLKTGRLETERLDSRFIDIANYAAMMYVWVKEETEFNPLDVRCASCQHRHGDHGGPERMGRCRYIYPDSPDGSNLECECIGFKYPAPPHHTQDDEVHRD